MTLNTLLGEICIPANTPGEAECFKNALSRLRVDRLDVETPIIHRDHVIARFQAHYEFVDALEGAGRIAHDLHAFMDLYMPYGTLTFFNPERMEGRVMELHTGECAYTSLKEFNNPERSLSNEDCIAQIRNRGLFIVLTYLISENRFDEIYEMNTLLNIEGVQAEGSFRSIAREAIYSKNPEVFTWLCENGWPQLRQGPEDTGINLLAYAASVSNAMTQFMLTQRQWVPDATTLPTELSRAARDGDVATIETLVTAGFNPRLLDEENYSLLKWVMAGTQRPERRELLEWLFLHHPETFREEALPSNLLDPEKNDYCILKPYFDLLSLQSGTEPTSSTRTRSRRSL